MSTEETKPRIEPEKQENKIHQNVDQTTADLQSGNETPEAHPKNDKEHPDHSSQTNHENNNAQAKSLTNTHDPTKGNNENSPKNENETEKDLSKPKETQKQDIKTPPTNKTPTVEEDIAATQILDKEKKSSSKDLNKVNSEQPKNTPAVQDNSLQALADSFATIGNFFSVTKDNIAKQSNNTLDKITEIFMKSKLVTTCLKKQDDLNYSAVITSDLQGLRNSEAPQRISKNKRKAHDEEQQQESFALSSGSKLLKNLKSETSNHDQSTLRESNMIVKSKNPKTSFSQSKERSEGKPKYDYEEQIRQHKIQEIMKMKKNLEDKLSALNEQLHELQKSEQSPSPVKTQPKKRETKEEILERQKQAKEFTKKMNLERKALEIRSEKRREARQIQVTKEIDVLQQNRVKNTEVLHVLKNENKSIGPNSRISKAAQARSALEERKQELKAKREFEKNLEGSPEAKDVSQSQEKKSKSKIPNKSYKSPMLPQVLAHDAELKKAENEKIMKRKTLHEKQLEYAKEVKESFLPKLKSKYDARKLKMGIYKSHNVETYLAKVAKERLFENPLQPKPKYSEENAYTFKKTPVKSKDISRNSTHTNDEGAERNSHHKNAKVNRSRYEDEDDFSERTSAKRVNPQLQENFMFGEAANSNKSQSYVNSQGDSPIGSHNLDFGLQGKKIRDKVLGVHSSQISEPNTIHSSHRTPNKRGSLVKGYGDSENWKEELQQDQAELKKKISGMLEDIKKMEDHVKNKEEKISKDIDAIKAQ